MYDVQSGISRFNGSYQDKKLLLLSTNFTICSLRFTAEFQVLCTECYNLYVFHSCQSRFYVVFIYIFNE